MKLFKGLCALLLLAACASSPEEKPSLHPDPPSGKTYEMEVVGLQPSSLKEVSGIITLGDNNPWVLEDSGNDDEIYKINYKGDKLRTIELKSAKNSDWEAITKDADGNVYVGDFGNNSNERKDLVIYKIPNPEGHTDAETTAASIAISYADQTEYPPANKDKNYDMEAFFAQGNYLYLFSKNRTNPWDGKTHVYKVSTTPGTYELSRIASFQLSTSNNNDKVTDAAISPDGKTIALLSYEEVYILEGFDLSKMQFGKPKPLGIEIYTQMESICFADNSTLILADEVVATIGGNLYRINLE
ncbi:MAG: hypothetical protein OIF50_09310 [Flavobacteriaceae bacterium]|nr:hypothetical protein [Flavobacteriaceae bacterium]